MLEWLQNSPLAVYVSEDWFPWIESMHVVCLALVAGTIFLVDTRLLGFTSRQLRVTYLSDRLLPWTWTAFVGAAITGGLMFIAGATHYASNAPFLIKMALLVLAGINMLYFQFVTFRSVQNWDTGRPSQAARTAGGISMTIWVLVIGFGRWIGFV
ncbi:MAG TPA: DUF6644 family protein [Steroidobacteraceae bacterium]|nr:DUF6644 family protein [Steroidobacteraceae bacterium]